MFTDAADVLFDSTIRYDASFFDVARPHRAERAVARPRPGDDRSAAGRSASRRASRSIPDAKTKAALDAGVREAQAWLEAKYDAGLPPFYEGGHWTLPALPELIEAVKVDFADPDKYPVDARGLTYSYAYIGIKRLGAGQFYLISIKDKDGNAFDGGKTYRLTVPAERAGRAVLVGDGLRPARRTR